MAEEAGVWVREGRGWPWVATRSVVKAEAFRVLLPCTPAARMAVTVVFVHRYAGPRAVWEGWGGGSTLEQFAKKETG